MGRAPATCAYASKQLCTAVAGLDGHETVLAGFADGSVLTGRPADEYELENLVVKGSSGSAVSALALTSEGWLLSVKTADVSYGCKSVRNKNE